MKLTIDLDKAIRHGDASLPIYRKTADLIDQTGQYLGKVDINLRLEGKTLAEIVCNEVAMKDSFPMNETVYCKIVR